MTEVEEAIDNLNSGKSPGPDGFTSAFYKEFKHDIAPLLSIIFNEAYDINALPLSYGSSVRMLIPKTDDPRKLTPVTAYRPIALNNVEYKILMKTLA